MNKCTNCNLYIADNAEVCPLCHSVLEECDKTTDVTAFTMLAGGAPYPNVRKLQEKLQFIMRLLLFCFIVAEVILVFVNLEFFHGIYWSAITGIGMLYFYISMLYWLRHDSGHASKIGLQLVLTVLLVMGIDYFSGATGWSLEWAAPCIILVGDGIVFLLMLMDRKQWYSYTLLLFLIALFCFGVIGLYALGRIQHIVLMLVSVGVTFTYILGTFIFGDRAMKRELKRRFHV